jgi:stalled ribosome rescue protein Dom34
MRPRQHIHHKANARDSGHAPVDTAFLKEVADNLLHVPEILITGPANAKQQLSSYLKEKLPEVAGRVAGVEPLDHPSDGELLRMARKFFKVADRRLPESRTGAHQ